MANSDKGFIYEKHGNWLFSKFKFAEGVISAETKVKGYDEAWLDMIEEELRDRRYRVFIDRTEYTEYAKSKKKTRIEVYKKFKDGTFRENIDSMLADFDDIFNKPTQEFIPDIPDAPQNPQW